MRELVHTHAFSCRLTKTGQLVLVQYGSFHNEERAIKYNKIMKSSQICENWCSLYGEKEKVRII